MVPDGLRDKLGSQRKADLRAARLLASAAADRDAAAFAEAVHRMNETVDGWRFAMTRIARLPAVSAEIQNVWIGIWVEHKSVPRAVGDRRLLARALRRLMPCDYRGERVLLYKGTTQGERRRCIYGFSWTRDLEIARNFARRHAEASDKLRAAGMENGCASGVVLETMAPSGAILLFRDDEDNYDESVAGSATWDVEWHVLNIELDDPGPSQA
jgi:hypothetical protein